MFASDRGEVERARRVPEMGHRGDWAESCRRQRRHLKLFIVEPADKQVVEENCYL